MRGRQRLTCVCILIAAAFVFAIAMSNLSGVAVRADDKAGKKFELDDLTGKARKAIEKTIKEKYPGAKIPAEGTQAGPDDDRKYTLTIDHDGKKVELTFDDDGKLLSTKDVAKGQADDKAGKKFELDDLTGKVRKAMEKTIKENYPDAKIPKEGTQSGDEDNPTYTLTINNDGKKVVLTFDANGELKGGTGDAAKSPKKPNDAKDDDKKTNDVDYPGGDQIGYGWNALGNPIDPATKGKRITSQQCPSPPKTSKDTRADFHTVTAESTASLTRKLKIETQAEGKYGGFSASVEAKFGSSSESESNRYVGIATASFVTGSYEYDQKTIDANLDDTFKKRLNDSNISPEKLFREYGTHVIAKINVGGRMQFYCSSEKKSCKDENTFSLAIKAAYKGAGEASGKGEVTKEEQTAKSSTELNISTNVVGGKNASNLNAPHLPSAEDTAAWEKTLENDKDNSAAYIGRPVNGLIPLWRFCEEDDRRDEIKNAYLLGLAKRIIENPVLFSQTVEVQGDKVKDASLKVPKGYKILSGGVRVNLHHVICQSWPDNNTTWSVTTKAFDGGTDNKLLLTMKVLAIYDPDNHWNVELSKKEYSVSPKNNKDASLTLDSSDEKKDDVTRFLVGGGASAEGSWQDGNNFALAHLEPTDQGQFRVETRGWDGENRKLQVRAIFLSPNSEAAQKLHIDLQVFKSQSPILNSPSKTTTLDSDWVLVGGGAKDFFRDKTRWGALVASLPEDGGWYGQSWGTPKGQDGEDEHRVEVYAIGLKVNLPKK